MSEAVKCPVCRNASGGRCRVVAADERNATGFDCDVCGTFEISDAVLAGPLDPERVLRTPMQRAALSHRLRTTSRVSGRPVITADWLEAFLANAALPSPSAQAANIIRHIGDEVIRSGAPLGSLPVDLPAVIGAPTREFAANLAKDLRSRGILTGTDATSAEGTQLLRVGLTLDGWQYYEAETRGRIAGDYGFLALQPGHTGLDRLIEDVVVPAVRDEVEFDLVGTQSVGGTRVIDNVLRAQIRDAAFAIADLSHVDAGVHWAAGYAEGLGKPVVYICEQPKFGRAKMPFDPDHCTVVLWSDEKGDAAFREELVATLRLALNQFPSSS